MAARFGIFLVVALIPVSFCQFTKYNRPIRLQTAEDCNQAGTTREFFDVSKLACIPCQENSTSQIASADLLSCVCRPGFRYLTNHGGKSARCEQCAVGQISSSSGYNCITCPPGTDVDPATNRCRPCPGALAISPERSLTGTFYINAGQNTIQCQTCSADTQPNADNTRCEKCINNLPVSENNNCSCPNATKENTGGFCFPKSTFSEVTGTVDQLFVIPQTTRTQSAYFVYNLKAAFGLCRSENITACQVLANLCVLTLYEYLSTQLTARNACEMYMILIRVGQTFAPPNVPWLYYITERGERIDGSDVLSEDYLQKQYTFNPRSMLEYRVGQYSLDGTYDGMFDVLNGRIQLCPDTAKRLNAAYVFGTVYKQKCKISAIELWDQIKYPLKFFDPYLEITQNGDAELYAVPVNILNYRSLDESFDEVNRGEAKYMQLFRRFFLVDNVGTATSTGPASVVRFAQTMHIAVGLQEETTQGVIYPPTIQIEYGSVTLEEAQAGAEVEVSFTVDYSYSPANYKRDFRIATGTLSTLAVIYAGYKTWVWSKRAGRPTIDFQTIGNFFFFCSGSLANTFFVITFGMAFYWLVFYKRQSVVYLVHPTEGQLEDWMGLFGSAFALKFLEVVHMIVMQCLVDVFFIDWERSRGLVGNAADANKGKESPVSIWRTYFVANEWNEIQAVRKINKMFQVWAVVFFLMVVGFENTATKDPDGSVRKSSDDYIAETSNVYRYAVAALVYMIVGIVQWIFFSFIYERFFEDKVRQFVDLCSMSNISVFVMAHAQFGHYIHGRSVHGKADTNMREMFEMMKKEEEDMCGQRGLLPNTEQQTFMMALPRKLRYKYESVLLPAQLESAAAAASADRGRGGRITGTAMEKQVEAYSTINKFLSAFIDHSLRDVDYVIKDKTFLENIMDTEFYDASEIGIFYNDDGHSFDRVLFYGNEITLLLFDLLTFCVADLIFTNFVVAGVITYLLSEIVCYVRNAGGERNLAKKTLVDERFLI